MNGRSREGAWIEITIIYSYFFVLQVAPARERGLKYVVIHSGLKLQERRSREGAWIEIVTEQSLQPCFQVAPARERGLK